MVELVFKGMCEGCKTADLSVETLDEFDMKIGMIHKRYHVVCEHEKACHAMRLRNRTAEDAT